MESIFLSYTYNPHPDHAALTERMVKSVNSMGEALGLRILNGVDLGGQVIASEVKRRITSSDALVALLTPQAGNGGGLQLPQYVADEFTFAKAIGKSAIRVIHDALPMGGMAQHEEHIPLKPGFELDAATKLLRTLTLWKRELGVPRKFRIEPEELGRRLDGIPAGNCQYKVKAEDSQKQTDWLPVEIIPYPGAVFAYLREVPDNSMVRVRFKVSDEIWDSQFTHPTTNISLIQST